MSQFDRVRLIGPLERALFLKSVDLLGSLDPAELAVFADHARERTFAAGETIFSPDVPIESFHAIVEGSVRATGHEHRDGETLLPRDTPGFVGLVAGIPNGLGAVALEDVTTLEFGEDALFDILEDNFPVLLSFLRYFARLVLDVRRRIPAGTYLAPLEEIVDVRGDDLDFVERMAIVRRPGTPFAESSLDALAELVHATPVVRFDAGTTLWKSGDRADGAFFLIRGTVVCTTQWGLSRFRAGPGYPLGNLERLTGDPRWYTAVTETALVAFQTDTETFFDLLEDHFEMASGVLRATARNAIRLREEEMAAATVGA